MDHAERGLSEPDSDGGDVDGFSIHELAFVVPDVK